MMQRMVLITLLLLAITAAVGNSLECNKMHCSGGLGDCVNRTEICLMDEPRCSSLVVNNEGELLATLGCARETDCMANDKTCSQVMKDSKDDKMKTTCDSHCCSTNNCNKPLLKDSRLCYSCSSTKSMSDCTDKSVPTVCQPGEQCFTIMSEITKKETGVKIMTYAKGCYTEEQCKQTEKNIFNMGCSGEDDNCKISCCKDDMCNAGSFSTVSGLALIACVVLTVFQL